MNKDKLSIFSSVAEIVSSIAILITLIFLAVQMSHNTVALRSQTLQSIGDISINTTLSLAESDEWIELSFLYNKEGRQAFSEVQLMKMDMYLSALIRVQQLRYMQGTMGFLDIDTIQELGGANGLLLQPIFQDFWARRAASFSPGFQSYVNRVIEVAQRDIN